MTSENFPSKLFIPQPFASGAGAALKPIEADETNNNPNFKTGFPSVYSAFGGKFVMRSELNAIGNLASVNEYVNECGGIYTFSQDLCNAIGGYAKGAVLQYQVGRNFYYVMSMKDDNTVNFVTEGVDGVNWIFCNTPEPGDIGYVTTITGNFDGAMQYDSSSWRGSYIPYIPVVFKANTSGLLKISGTAKINTNVFTASGVDYDTSAGMLIVSKEFNALNDAASWQPSESESKGTVITTLGVSTVPSTNAISNQQITKYQTILNDENSALYSLDDVQALFCSEGKYYAICLCVRNAYNSTEIAIQDSNITVNIVK